MFIAWICELRCLSSFAGVYYVCVDVFKLDGYCFGDPGRRVL